MSDVDAICRELESHVRSGDVARILRGLLGLSMSELDYELAQRLCLEFATHADDNVRGLAVLCLGHIARVYRRLDIAAAEQVIQAALIDPSAHVCGQADAARDDIVHYVADRATARRLRAMKQRALTESELASFSVPRGSL